MAILIIDDDPVQRRLLEGMLQKFGYEVAIAEGGDAGAALLTGPDGASIDCVILDLVMPDLDGLGGDPGGRCVAVVPIVTARPE